LDVSLPIWIIFDGIAMGQFGEGVQQMDQPTSTDPVLWRVDERDEAYVTLNRPEVCNAYNGDLIAALLGEDYNHGQI
jgi:hypothetical protein